jgi:translation initiation factor 3 subunit A
MLLIIADEKCTPKSVVLYCSAVSGEDAQDRSDRTILTPWVKFLWESYCQCLELLRTNAHVETLYHDIARMVSLLPVGTHLFPAYTLQ